ncbi:hypothetical protein [Pseudoxanthomonas indica]|uniref:Pilus assembly protein n=1 Tax=Pseudoxanthomonas indica TaxID=428993 RepID=A0A1T5LH87_9GAMM|nr:hypothetical protein [Pseudoxanthomonas indica]GGD34930.1 fimb protein [Pseudoxanthomonas indica]SKC75095.1 hypothetical protein SAMN06296058_2481 [Pseudoxanthomonas indica]
MNRWKASAVHLLLSLLLIGGIALTALHTWFPFGLYRVAAPDRLLYVMWGIDLVAGPLLTLVVYKAGKPSLRFDLTVIAILQLAFLSYGLHTLWVSRPVFLVAMPMRMSLVFANEIEPSELAKANKEEWRRLSWSGPTLVGALAPKNDQERQDLLFATLQSGVDLDKMPSRYVEFSESAPALLAVARHVELAESERAGLKQQVKEVVLVTTRANGVMWLDASSGMPVAAWPGTRRNVSRR